LVKPAIENVINIWKLWVYSILFISVFLMLILGSIIFNSDWFWQGAASFLFFFFWPIHLPICLNTSLVVLKYW